MLAIIRPLEGHILTFGRPFLSSLPLLTARIANTAHGRNFMRQFGRPTALGLIAVTAGVAVGGGESGWSAARAQGMASVNARIVALNIPGASAIAEIGTFLNVPP